MHKGENTQLKWACCGMQGWRTEMEDAHLAVGNLTELHSKRVKMYTTLETSEDVNYTRNE